MTAPGTGPAGTAAPTGPGWDGGRQVPRTSAPTRSSTRSLLVVALVAILLGGGVSAFLLSRPSYDLRTPQGAAQAFTDAVRERDVAGLKEIVCSRDRYRVDDADSGLLQQALGLDLTVGDVEVERGGDRATAQVSVQGAGASGGSFTFPLQRSSSSGLWTVCLSDELR